MKRRNAIAIGVATVGAVIAFGVFYWAFKPNSPWEPYVFSFVVFAYCEYVTNDILE